MEHDLLQLLQLPSQDHHMVNSEFFGVAGGGAPVHVPCSDDLVGLDDCGWMEDLMHLGDEPLFAGDDNNNASLTVDHQASLRGGGSAEGPPPLSVSVDDGGEGSPPPSVEQGDVSAATPKRRDRSKTIVSERKRRFRMKEKLYELRALVPNITKVSYLIDHVLPC
jgi:hypothetical protein